MEVGGSLSETLDEFECDWTGGIEVEGVLVIRFDRGTKVRLERSLVPSELSAK